MNEQKIQNAAAATTLINFSSFQKIRFLEDK